MPARLSAKRGVTTQSAKFYTSMCTMPNGSNPHALDSIMREMHQDAGDHKRLVFLLHQKQASHHQFAVAPQRTLSCIDGTIQVEEQTGQTLHAAWMDSSNPLEPLDVTLDELGANSSLEHQYVRTIVRDILQSKVEYQERWREQNIAGSIWSMDHSLKALKCTIWKNRFTIMNEFGQIVLAISLPSTTYNDPAMRQAFKAVVALFNDGRALLRLVFIDAPARDGPGALRMLKEILFRSVDDSSYIYPGEIYLLWWYQMDVIATACDNILQTALQSKAAPGVVSLDCEWYAPRTSGQPVRKDTKNKRRPIALLQIASLEHCLELRLPAAEIFSKAIESEVFNSHSIPHQVLELLHSESLVFVGVKIKQDLKYLEEDYKCSLVSSVKWQDLSQLANEKPGLLKRSWGLESLAMTFVGVKLEKSDTATSNWEAGALSPDQIKYAAADVGIAIDIKARLSPVQPNNLAPTGAAAAAQRAEAAAQQAEAAVGEALISLAAQVNRLAPPPLPPYDRDRVWTELWLHAGPKGADRPWC